MENFLSISNVTFSLGILGVIFAIYRYFHEPQEATDKKNALLAQQIQWTTEGNERKFKELQDSVKDAFTLAQNHTHSVELKVDLCNTSIVELNKELVKLGVIIDERIPRK